MNKGVFYSRWYAAQEEIAEMQKRIERGEKINILSPIKSQNLITKNNLTK